MYPWMMLAGLLGLAAPATQPARQPDPYVPTTGRFSHAQLVEWAGRYGTPLYVYDGDLIEEKLKRFRSAFDEAYDGEVKVHYALKANTNLSIVSLLKRGGAAAECISAGEIQIALRLGWRGEDILFTSSSKSPAELELAVRNGVIINLDSHGDLLNLKEVTGRLKQKARISFRLNPDVDPHTHRHIATGHKYSKFGIGLENDELIRCYREAKEWPWIETWGIHSHIGSQITELEPFERNVQLLTQAALRLHRELGIELKFIDLGGGLGIPYRDGQSALTPESVASAVCLKLREALKELPRMPALWLEPGRYFVGDSGILLARVNSVKETPYRNFINVDTGFNHLARPILYEAYHRVRVLGRSEDIMLFDLAGNICETGDILAHDRLLPKPRPGDVVAILDAGAYGFSMASEYNSFNLPAEILVRRGKIDLIRSRGSFDDLLRNQTVPHGLAAR